MHSSRRLGLTCILIKHYLRTISRSIWRQPARFNWYLCSGNGVPLAYAAVGPSGSGGRDEQSRQNAWKKGKMRKSLPFKGKKKQEAVEWGGGFKQWWWKADSSLRSNEMIIRVLMRRWTAIVPLMLGAITDFPLRWLAFITLRLCPGTIWYSYLTYAHAQSQVWLLWQPQSCDWNK